MFNLQLVAIFVTYAVEIQFAHTASTSAQASHHTSDVAHNIIKRGINIVGCGVRGNTKVTASRIVGGQQSTSEWPWMVAIYMGGTKFICGGSVIDHRHILTAAHCFETTTDPRMYKIQAGDLYRKELVPHAELYELDDIYLHAEYYPQSTMDNDIAILRLKVPLPAHIVPVCLPHGYHVPLQPGEMTTILGWGDLWEGGQGALALQELHGLPVVSNQQCQAIYQAVEPGQPHSVVGDNKICAGGHAEGGKDSCQGDSGGPLLRQYDNGQWSQEGVTSYGTGCARPGVPGVYTKVANYIPWIQNYVDYGIKETRATDYSFIPHSYHVYHV